MKTLLAVIEMSADYLQKRGVVNARRQAEELVADLFSLKRIELYMQFDRPLNDEELAECRGRLRRRGLREPLQYIHGFVEFFECQIEVNRNALIPRQETELFVEKVAERFSSRGAMVLWDVCCGSGCIGIALKRHFPDWTVTLADLSPQALALAKRNAQRNGAAVRLLEGDLLTPFADERADLICCNPPYVSQKEYCQLEPEVRDFEPRQALVAGETGLEFYERLRRSVVSHLARPGWAAFEIGAGQGAALESLFKEIAGAKITIEKDLAGEERFFFLEIE